MALSDFAPEGLGSNDQVQNSLRVDCLMRRHAEA